MIVGDLPDRDSYYPLGFGEGGLSSGGGPSSS
jgi:hypothetical protein